MTEADARAWVADRFGAPAVDRLDHLASIVLAEAEQQNLIARSTLDVIWVRHIADSAQLLTIVDLPAGPWMDIGTGAGFPGLVIAILRDAPMLFVEPRRKRAEYLTRAAAAISLPHVRVAQAKVEKLSEPAAIISARAVGSIESVFAAALPCTKEATLWLLPKGRSAHEEVAAAQRSWQALFHVEQSLTDPQSLIVTARKVSRR